MSQETKSQSPSPEQIQLVRESFYKTVQDNYLQLVASITNIPIIPQHFHQALVQFDLGILCAREAIYYGSLIVPSQPENKDLAEETESSKEQEVTE